MSSQVAIASSFIKDAPPGEIQNVLEDVKILLGNDSGVLGSLEGAFETYSLENFREIQLSKLNHLSLATKFNHLGSNKFYDAETNSSYSYDYVRGTVSDVSNYNGPEIPTYFQQIESQIGKYVSEYYPSKAAYGVFPQNNGTIIIAISGSKYSPSNFWNGKWRSWYIFNKNTNTLDAHFRVDIHYYEDGNVRLTCEKDLSSIPCSTDEVGITIFKLEKDYQNEINSSLVSMSETEFKSLRRQLPVTRSKIEWDKAISGYRLGQDIGGGRTSK